MLTYVCFVSQNTLSQIHLMHVANETNVDMSGGKNLKFYVNLAIS